MLLGERLVEFVEKYMLKVWEQDGAVNTKLVMAGAKGIVECLDRTLIVDYGGDIIFTTLWAKSLLKRMNSQNLEQ